MDQAVYPLQDAVVDFRREPAQHPIPMTIYCIGRLFDGFQAAVGCPKVPFLEKGLGGVGRLLVQFLEIESDVVGADSGSNLPPILE